MLKSKIHRATVTEARIDYVGSITIDSDLLKRSNILPYEKVLVVSLDSGQRLETYAIEGEPGSKKICTNGTAARKIIKGDKIIIMAFCLLEEGKAKNFKPNIIHVDENNNFISLEDYVQKSDQC
jgi:aspartate 1-decarboxylase